MNERSFIVKFFDKTGFKDRDFGLARTPASSEPASGPAAKGLAPKSRAALAPLRGIRGFVRLGRYRCRHPLRLLDKLQDRQDCA
jgi:hypothetical protein